MSGEFTLDTAQEQSALKITRITGSGSSRLRMLQMGITPGTRVEILRQAPLTDPVEILVRGTKLALRREEAKNINVVKAEGQ
ncbi:MAG: FeoA family protein [Negativicutes bacterium]|nr:FeoA family protein [Negativicutes bacterium]